MIKPSLTIVALVACFNLFAQDTLVTSPRYREMFARTEFREDIYKMTKADFDNQYTKGQNYKVLLVYADPMRASEEVMVKFKGLEDLCSMSKLEVYNRLQPNRPTESWKGNLETFVFDEKYIFRREAVGPSNDATMWGILVLNGPIWTIKTFGPSLFNSGKEGYTTKKFKGTLQNKKQETVITTKDPHDEESSTRFKGRMNMYFKECEEIGQKVEADTPGYGKPDLLKMILEYNECIKNNDKEYFEASIYPKVAYRK